MALNGRPGSHHLCPLLELDRPRHHCDEDALTPLSPCHSSHRPACNRYSIVLLSPERGSPLMAALAFALHILGAVVWVGGMFAIYACLRPALGTLEQIGRHTSELQSPCNLV